MSHDQQVRETVETAFDAAYYLDRYPDVRGAGMDPVAHYLTHGWQEGRDPSAEFSTSAYLASYPDVAASGMNPLFHYVRHGRKEGRKPNPATARGGIDPARLEQVMALVAHEVDPDFYRTQNPDVAAAGIDPVHHFCAHGWREGRDPGPRFSLAGYLALHPDLAMRPRNPLEHFVLAGGSTERTPVLRGWRGANDVPNLREASVERIKLARPYFDVAFYAAQMPADAPVADGPIHYIAEGADQGLDPHPAFSTRYYQDAHPDACQEGVNPFVHFIESGQYEGRLPNAGLCGPDPETGLMDTDKSRLARDMRLVAPHFDADFYCRTYGQMADPLHDYCTTGWAAGRDPSPGFSTRAYLDARPRVAEAGLNPLVHHVIFAPFVARDAAEVDHEHWHGSWLHMLNGFGIDSPLYARLSALPFDDMMQAIATPGPDDLLSGQRPDMDKVAELNRQLHADRPDLWDAPQDEIGRRTFALSGIQHLVARHLGALPDDAFDRWYRVRGGDALLASVAAGRKVLVVGGHVGNGWNVIQWLTRQDVPVLNVQAGWQFRPSAGGRPHKAQTLSVGSMFYAAVLAGVCKALRAGSLVHMLPDGGLGSGGTARRFLGREMVFHEGFAYAAHAEADELWTVTSVHLPDGVTELTFGRELGEIPKALPRAEAIEVLMLRYVAFLEDLWRSEPGNVEFPALVARAGLPAWSGEEAAADGSAGQSR
ncbi:hypothetical protein [Marinibacterium sp. SX1]|uniref:hypothetical protein n=1 Tax=Marinibacterium sp. SX1 TaxID=3388424 RepID=UPI003D1834EE